MSFSARRRGLAGVLLGAVIALAGCAVPGQPAAPGAAVALGDTSISNARVSQLYDAWRDDAAQSTSRRSVITLELMREPLLDKADELEVGYHRSVAEQQAQMTLRLQGQSTEPSETLIDAIEGAYLVGVFAVTPEYTDVLAGVAADIEANVITNARSGDFSVQVFEDSLVTATEQATTLANQGMPAWAVGFRTVNGFTEASAEWRATQSSTTQTQ